MDQVRKGKRAETGIKKEAWTSALAELNASRQETDRISKQQAQNHLAALKKKYTVFSTLKNASGFGWDISTLQVTAPHDVWTSYIASHKEAGQFRGKGLTDFWLMEELWSSVVATGQYSGQRLRSFVEDALSNADEDAPEILDFTVPFSSGPSSSARNSDVFEKSEDESVKRARVAKRVPTIAEALRDMAEVALMKVEKPARKTKIDSVVVEAMTDVKSYLDSFDDEEVLTIMEALESASKSNLFLQLPERSKKVFLDKLLKSPSP